MANHLFVLQLVKVEVVVTYKNWSEYINTLSVLQFNKHLNAGKINKVEIHVFA